MENITIYGSCNLRVDRLWFKGFAVDKLCIEYDESHVYIARLYTYKRCHAALGIFERNLVVFFSGTIVLRTCFVMRTYKKQSQDELQI